jgi:putative membrane protein
MNNNKIVFRIITAASILIFALVVILNRKILPVSSEIPSFVFKLPAMNAIINACCSLLLISSYLAIRKKNITLHKKLNLTAFCLSALFLLSYVTVHYFIPDTKFGDLNHNQIIDPEEKVQISSIRPFYLFLLLSHILLAAIVLPLVLISFYFGLSGQNEKHKKIVRFSFPIWLYVTITGVIVYLMISPYYSF